MRTQINKISAARNGGDNPPPRRASQIVIRRFLVESNSDTPYRADCALLEERLNLQKPGKCPAVVRDEERDVLPTTGLNHLLAFRIVTRHRLFDVHWLPGFGCNKR